MSVSGRRDELVTEMPAASPASPRPLLTLLSQRSVGAYILGMTLNNAGTWVKDIAAVILLYQMTGSATVVATVAVAGYGSSFVLAPFGGVLADRVDRVRLLHVIHLGQAIAAAALAFLTLVGSATPLSVFLLLLLMGFGKSIAMPVLHAVVPSIVEESDLAPALTLQSLTFNGTRAIGPAIGAFAAAAFGPGVAFALSAVTFAAFSACMLFVDVQDRIGSESSSGPSGVMSTALRDPKIRFLLLGMAVAGAVSDPLITLGPALAVDYGFGPSYAGYLVAGFGAGSMISAPFVAPARHRYGSVRSGGIGLALVVVGFLSLSMSRSGIFSIVAATVVGAGFLIVTTDFTTTLQLLLPSPVRGRIMSLWTVAYFGSRPFAALASGAVADASSSRLGFIPVLAASVAMLFACWRRRPPGYWDPPRNEQEAVDIGPIQGSGPKGA